MIRRMIPLLILISALALSGCEEKKNCPLWRRTAAHGTV